MSDMRIKDGTGDNYMCRVDAQNRLTVAGSMQAEEHFISSAKGLAYFANTADTADTLTLTGNSCDILYIKNVHASKQLVIAKVLVSADTAGAIIKWKRNPTIGTIGNNNVHQPKSLNFSSNSNPDATVYSWDEVGDGMTGITVGDTINTFIAGSGFTVFPIDSAMILERNNSLLINVKGTGELSVGVRMFFMDKEVA